MSLIQKTFVVAMPLAALLLAADCSDVPVDDFEFENGTAPAPTGVMRGTVLYSGPRPRCVLDEDGNPEPVGNVILTLFEYDNPPPPSGDATGAANLLTIPGLSVFSGAEDCMPEDPTPADLAFITRAASFVWPELPLGHDYQIRGFFDYDGNFNPFFSVTNIPTAGDIAGGAFVDPTAAIREFRRISFESEGERPNGQVIEGISVALGAPVVTERPIFRVESRSWLDSAALLPTSTDSVTRENQLLDLTGTELVLYDQADPGFPALNEALAAAGLPTLTPEGRLDFRGFAIGDVESPIPHAWYLRPVDADGDGEQDLHPILGASAGVFWSFPITILQRAKTELETQAGIPDVRLIPSVRPTEIAFARRVWDDRIDIGVPPIAAVTLNPADERCLVPYIPSGNFLSTYTRITVDCQEVPTGDYDVIVLQGLAGARPVGGPPGAQRMCTPELFGDDDAPPFLAENGCFDYPQAPPDLDAQIEQCNAENLCAARFPTEIGFDLEGGSYSGQNWRVPNELGDPRQLPDVYYEDPDADDPVLTATGSTLIREQGIGGRFTVTDSDIDGGVRGAGDCSLAIQDDMASGMFGMSVPIEYRTPFSEHFEELPIDDAEKESRRQALLGLCCEPVQRFCGIPLCGAADSPSRRVFGESVPVRGTPTSVDDNNLPDCVPFAIPEFCCEDVR